MNEYRKILLGELSRLGILELGEFQLKHNEKNPQAAKSIFKVNLRIREHGGPLIPSAVKAIAEEMHLLIRGEKIRFDRISGIPQAGEPFAEELSRLSGKPLLRLRKENSKEGRKIVSVLGNDFSAGQTVLLVDDVLTQGYSKEEAILVIRNAGLIISDLVVVVDREQGGYEFLKGIGCNEHRLFSILEVLYRNLAIGRISREKMEEIMAQIRAEKRIH